MTTLLRRHWPTILLVVFALALLAPHGIAVAYAAEVPTDAPPQWGHVRTYVALAAAVASIVGLLGLLHWFGKRLQVPGSNVALKIISSAQGWASLSQAQIILWTLVIGGGAVFVMVLNGELITIGATTLSLLGIAGIAAVSTQVHNSKQSQTGDSAPASGDTAAPGPISLLTQRAPLTASEIAFTWAAPTGGASSCTYAVYYRTSAPAPNTNPWFVGATALATPGIVLIGLASSVSYEVQVVATNANGSSAPATASFSTSAAVLPVGAPGAVTNLTAGTVNPTPSSLSLQWDPIAGASFRVEFRVHESAEPWRPGTVGPNPSAVQGGLAASTTYDFRTIAMVGGVDGPASNIFTGQTLTAPTRIPRWTDLVTDTDRAAEIDVTRVQMMFFTVISAAYVALHIVTEGAIKDVGATYVELMGISNGVYITSKFLR